MYHFYSYVVSEPHSRVPGDRNWRQRIMFSHFENGPQRFIPFLKENLGRRHCDLHGLIVCLVCPRVISHDTDNQCS